MTDSRNHNEHHQDGIFREELTRARSEVLAQCVRGSQNRKSCHVNGRRWSLQTYNVLAKEMEARGILLS